MHLSDAYGKVSLYRRHKLKVDFTMTTEFVVCCTRCRRGSHCTLSQGVKTLVVVLQQSPQKNATDVTLVVPVTQAWFCNSIHNRNPAAIPRFNIPSNLQSRMPIKVVMSKNGPFQNGYAESDPCKLLPQSLLWSPRSFSRLRSWCVILKEWLRSGSLSS